MIHSWVFAFTNNEADMPKRNTTNRLLGKLALALREGLETLGRAYNCPVIYQNVITEKEIHNFQLATDHEIFETRLHSWLNDE
jgi:hypothetical protein